VGELEDRQRDVKGWSAQGIELVLSGARFVKSRGASALNDSAFFES